MRIISGTLTSLIVSVSSMSFAADSSGSSSSGNNNIRDLSQMTSTMIPWSDLKDQLPSTVRMVDSPSALDYIDQCLDLTPPLGEPPKDVLAYYEELDFNMTAGLCLGATYLNGFQQSNPYGQIEKTVTLDERFQWFLSYSHLTVEDPVFDPSNPSFDIPMTTVFPQTPGDVVTVVKFAKQHNIELSVKNSGHSYKGASQKKDTLLLNMQEFAKYSSNATNGGLVECTVIDDDDTDLPCKLASARNKRAYLRVGGGENFAMAYTSVKNYNENLVTEGSSTSYQYILIGGAWMAVSPLGWTMEGGLAGSTGGRQFGLGVDQVLQIDMVLPSGSHIRFGPVGTCNHLTVWILCAVCVCALLYEPSFRFLRNQYDCVFSP